MNRIKEIMNGISIRKITSYATLSAWFFLVLMVCQIGAHAAIDSHGHGGFGHAANQSHHEDDHHEFGCVDAVNCSEDPDHDDQIPASTDENNHHHLLSSANSYDFLRPESHTSQRLGFDDLLLSTRSQAPPVLPPKRS